jgi:hypothetical protein
VGYRLPAQHTLDEHVLGASNGLRGKCKICTLPYVTADLAKHDHKCDQSAEWPLQREISNYIAASRGIRG